jgi:hypothetical protein
MREVYRTARAAWRQALVGLLLLVASGCGPGGPLGVRLRPDVERPQPGAVLFLCDGMSVDLVRQGCREGWLPNIQKRFVEGGTQVRQAVTSFPTITYGILTTYATGVSPARHGIIGNHWFDRSARLYRDYATIETYREVNQDFAVPTIYELIKPATSASIQSPVKRGLTQNFANWAVSGTMWFFHEYTAVDKLTATTIERVARWANGQRRWPALLTCYFPGADSIAHEFGVDSPRYRRAIWHLDYQIGRICDWLEWQGLLDTTYLVLVSDHGMVPVHADGIVDLMTYIRETLGRVVTDRPVQDGTFEHRQRYFDRFDTVYVKSAMRWATIHFAGSAGWDSRADPETVRSILQAPPEGQRLWDLPGIDLVAYAVSAREVVLRSPNGSARIEEREGEGGLEYRYVPVPDDVLGYLTDPELAAFVASGFHGSRAWLCATTGQTYPDLVPHLVPLSRCPRVGEVMLFAAHGYSFGYEESGHGGIHRQEVCIPLMFAGPGIEPGGTIALARAVDVVPTLMTFLSCDLPEDDTLEGVPLFSRSPLPSSGGNEGKP